MKSELMDLQTVAEWLQVSPRTVLRRTAAGELPGFRRIGRASRWSRTVLRLWVLQAETSQRGFLLTRQPDYRTAYAQAVTETRRYMDTILSTPAFRNWKEAALQESWIVPSDEVD